MLEHMAMGMVWTMTTRKNDLLRRNLTGQKNNRTRIPKSVKKAVANEAFNDWLFHFSPYKREWSAFKREYSNDYFNGVAIPEDCILRSSDIKLILHYINWNGKVNKKA